MLTQEPHSGQIQRMDLQKVHPTTRTIPPFLYRVAILWGFILAALFFALISYGNTAGPSDPPPETAFTKQVDGVSEINTSSGWELMMAVHPKCPCTVASVNELQHLLDQFGDQLKCRFLVYHPADTDAAWIEDGITPRLSEIPQASIEPDETGKTALALGMQTSGAVVVFDSQGIPCFHGGITVSRNHEGDNLGVRAISMLLQGKSPPITSTPVFGCRL
ncbi:MAG: RedB [Rhodopirellula sp. JB055]|uniref:RedB n=1 Tax=Rhodopirellula sp. JB055 TaxID=3342846 RepID=UPI00370A6873